MISLAGSLPALELCLIHRNKMLGKRERKKRDILNFSKYVGETSCNFTPRT